MGQKYYIGLDCGTSSVGWAATDENYELLKAKGKTLWGSRLFDEASTAEERRLARSNRRRTRRSSGRIKLLNLLFDKEMAKVDPEFFLRLKRSFLYEEDKNLKNNSKNTLFNDKNFTDKDFYKKYPTIWHLRKAIIEAPENSHFDLRLYYLAIHHIIKNRGHFLREGKIKGAGDFAVLYDNLINAAEPFNLIIKEKSNLEQIITNRDLKITDRRKAIKTSIFAPTDDDEILRCQDELAGLLAGSKITPAKIFGLEPDEDSAKLSLASDSYEDKIVELEKELDQDQINLLNAAKQIYDFGFLSELLNGEEFISRAMVNNYDNHAEDLKELKKLLKPFKEDYDAFFKAQELKKDGDICYNSYIGQAYTKDKNGRKKSAKLVSQEDLNKEIKRIFEKNNIKPTQNFAKKLEQNELLPKQRGQAKGTIPQQLHHNELEIILDHLAKDYPSFSKKTLEPEKYNTPVKKILSIHDFRIPYYCGPLVSKDKSDFSWADAEIKELVRPWNFYDLVDTAARADKFIKHMTNKCTYLPTEDVLPKASLLYQEYMVLNELNNLKINGQRIDDTNLKQKIYENAFEKGELKGNVTVRNLEKYLRENGLIEEKDSLSGTAESKYLPKLSTHQDFQNIFGSDYRKVFKADQLEKVVELITILNNEPKMLEQKILDTLGDKCSKENAHKLSRKKYNDWGKFSQKFLTGIYVDKGTKISIIDALYNTNHNLMELLGEGEYNFNAEIEKVNSLNSPEDSEINYQDVENLYCSPAVKRSIWQAIKVVDDVIKSQNNQTPAKIFLESTRGGEPKKQGKETNSRYKEIKSLLNSKETKELLLELEKIHDSDPSRLRSKKLYLYFSQMGRCAYSGERIDLENLLSKEYDIDHIYPRSKTKDDSIRKNLVLVKAKYNRDKTNTYPIEAEWRKRMQPTWFSWYRMGLIGKEKYERLTRGTPLSAEELSGFVARQIVETSQTIKALRDLLKRKYQNTKVVLVKAGQVKDLRDYFSRGNDDSSNHKDVFKPKPEFIKIRDLNDLHHAKDAYLNIVVGNVMSETYTDNPARWFRDPSHQEHYSINSHTIWKAKPRPGDYYKGWNYQDSIDIISKNMKKNYVLCTRMTHEVSGAITDLQPVGKTTAIDGILPLRENLPIEKYGGYNSIKGSYFSLIETEDKKGNTHRKIVQVPIYAKRTPEDYLKQKYNAQIIIPKILFKSRLIINGCPMRLYGRTGSNLILAPDLELYLDHKNNHYLRAVVNCIKKLKVDKNYKLPSDTIISKEENQKLFKILCEKLKIFQKFPSLSVTVEKILAGDTRFTELSVEEGCQTINNLLTAFQANTTVADLSSIADGAAHVGKCTISNDLTDHNEVKLILESPSGIYTREIDLKTTSPLCPGA